MGTDKEAMHRQQKKTSNEVPSNVESDFLVNIQDMLPGTAQIYHISASPIPKKGGKSI